MVVIMDFHQTVLPPPPSTLISLRASLGALWFRASSAVHDAIRHNAARTRRARPRIALPAPTEALASLLEAPSFEGATLRKIPRVTCPINDKWLRTTHVLDQAAAK